jgi:hypothetical protein
MLLAQHLHNVERSFAQRLKRDFFKSNRASLNLCDLKSTDLSALIVIDFNVYFLTIQKWKNKYCSLPESTHLGLKTF